MKKLATIIGLLSLMLVVTSFTTPSKIGGNGKPVGDYTSQIGGNGKPVGDYTSQIGGNGKPVGI